MAGWSCTVALGLVSLLGLVALSLAIQVPASSTLSNFKQGANFKVQSRSYLSTPFTVKPGEVTNQVHTMELPTGHIALKGLTAEVVDEMGNSVPLTDFYLHHWVFAGYYFDHSGNKTVIHNDGVCQGFGLDQIFWLDQKRHSKYAIPDPYGIVIGDPALVPEGSQELWFLSAHGIDIRSAADPSGCSECRCELYEVDVSTFKYANLVGANYTGGKYCCEDGQQCAGVSLTSRKTYHLKYTVRYVEWDSHIVPVRTYIYDAAMTDDARSGEKRPSGAGCKGEYDVPACDTSSPSASCVHTAESSSPIPKGGYVIFSVAHQHNGGMGCTLYGEDGRELCTSEPFYGSGTGAGNEAGYIVGMGACHPKPGSLKVSDGEQLRLQCRYSSLTRHTGVMSLQQILVADIDESSEAAGKQQQQLGTSQSAES